MRQKNSGSSLPYQVRKLLGAGAVGQMPLRRQDTAFQIIGIAAALQHPNIVIGFHHRHVAAGKSRPDLLGHKAQISGDHDHAAVWQ